MEYTKYNLEGKLEPNMVGFATIFLLEIKFTFAGDCFYDWQVNLSRLHSDFDKLRIYCNLSENKRHIFFYTCLYGH